jgi:hypothetical protein
MGRKKSAPEKKAKRVNITITPQDWESIKKIGGGSLSVGIRKLLQVYKTK